MKIEVSVGGCENIFESEDIFAETLLFGEPTVYAVPKWCQTLGLMWWYLRLRIWWAEKRIIAKRVRTQRFRQRPTINACSFPRAWDLLQYAIPKAIREQNYEPMRQELLEDYYIARARYTSRGVRFYLGCCFTVRTIVALFQSLTAWITSLGLERVSRIVPEPLRQWWFGLH